LEHFLVISIFLFLTVITILTVSKTRKRPIGFSHGILAGLLFFLAIPMAVILVTGQISNSGILAPSFYPYEDLETTATIMVGWLCVLVAFIICQGQWNTHPSNTFTAREYKRAVYVVLILYFFLSTYSLIKSGFGTEGNHWHKSLSTTLSASPTFLIAKNFSMCLRVMVYGILFSWQKQGFVSPQKAIFIAGIVTIFDVSTTFNRITLVFFAVMILLTFGRRAIWPSFLMMLAAPIASTLSSAWPYFRSNLFNQGFSFSMMSQTWQTAIQYTATEATSIDRKLNSLFEASNLIILNYIVKNVGKTFDPYWGYTAILRPITTFLPSSFWPGKPKVFGTYMGMEINSYKGLALNSTLFGEAVANFPYIWPIYLITFLVLMDRLYLVGSRYVPGLYTMSFFVAFALWRFDANFASIGLYTAVFISIPLILHKTLSKVSHRKEY
jgi:hypothetical protein